MIYGPVREVRRQFAGGDVFVAGEGDFAAVPGVVNATQVDGAWRLALAEGVTPAELSCALAARADLAIERFEVALPLLGEIFIRTVGEHHTKTSTPPSSPISSSHRRPGRGPGS